MKKVYVVVVIVIVGLLAFAIIQKKSENKDRVPATSHIHTSIQLEIDSLQNWYNTQWLPLTENGKEKDLQTQLKEGRQQYKKIEWAVDFFFPHTAKQINGTAVAEIEAQEHIIIPPSGFQVIEELVYPFEEKSRVKLKAESLKWNSLLRRLQVLWKDFKFRDDQVWIALRLNLLRMASLSLTGFDTPLSLTAIDEIRYNLASIKDVLGYYKKDILFQEFNGIENSIIRACSYILKNKDFTLFDRAYFIDQHLRPIANALLILQKKLNINTQNIYAINLSAGLFDSAAFNLNYFTSDASSWISKEKIALGKKIFNDPILSSSNTIACASCHKPEKAFTDGFSTNKSFGGGRLRRNTPTLYYAGLQQSQFYDMRALYLEDQVRNVVESKDEMHGSLPDAVKKLSGQEKYVLLFKQGFPQDKKITEWQVQVALSSYIRSLTPFTSKFDRFWQGKDVLTKEEATGLNLFMGKAQCGSCHFLPLFNGTLPPLFNTTESEVIGVPSDKKGRALRADLGRYKIHQIEELKGAFKTPTLRNVAATAPYMHNGVFQTLEEVVDFYNEGGAAGLKLRLENQTLSPEKLNLSEGEKSNLISFLKALTDKEVMIN